MPAITNLRMCFKNLWDTATAISTNGGGVTTNTKNFKRGSVWASSGISPYTYLRADFLSASTVNFFSILRHNLTQGSTWQIIIYDGAGQTGAILYDSGAVNSWGFTGSEFLEWNSYHSARYFTSVSGALSFEVRFFNSPLTTAFQIARIWIGQYFAPEVNSQYGAAIRWGGNTTQERAESGTLFPEGVTKWREIRFNLNFIQEVDRKRLMDFFVKTGTRGDFFFSLFPGESSDRESEYTGAFLIGENPPIEYSFFNNFSSSFSLVEI